MTIEVGVSGEPRIEGQTIRSGAGPLTATTLVRCRVIYDEHPANIRQCKLIDCSIAFEGSVAETLLLLHDLDRGAPGLLDDLCRPIVGGVFRFERGG